MQPLLTQDECAEYLKLSVRTIERLAVGRLTGEDFASRLDRAVDASNRAKLIEAQVIRDE